MTYLTMNSTDKNPDKIFVRDNLTDFEKLLFAQSQIKELKKLLKESDEKNGKLISAVDELKHYIQTAKEMTDYNKITQSINQLRKNNINLTERNRKLSDEIFKLKRL